MYPPKPEDSGNIEYEKLSTDDFLVAVIEEVQHERNRKFKGYQGADDRFRDAVRFKFKVEGYEFPHYSRWYPFSYHEKSNLYKLYITCLVENAEPWMQFDIENLEGMKVKTLWTEFNGFQNIDKIRPFEKKIGSDIEMGETSSEDTEFLNEEVPF